MVRGVSEEEVTQQAGTDQCTQPSGGHHWAFLLERVNDQRVRDRSSRHLRIARSTGSFVNTRA